MCTAIYQQTTGLFGRTLDLEHRYEEQVVVTPRGFRGNPYAFIGTATVMEGYPLYYDGMNEKGLAVAGLNFPHSAVFPPPQEGAKNRAVHQLIPALLGGCAGVAEAVALLRAEHLCDRPFRPDIPTAPLHWMVADRRRCVVVESTAAGVQIYENPVGTLTNEPPFPHQMSHLAQFAHLSPHPPENPWQMPLSRGCGAVGLPGDYSSPSRFVRAAFALSHSLPGSHPVGQFFHLLGTVEVPRGAVRLADGKAVISQYTCCMDLATGVYRYRTYDHPQVTAVPLHPHKDSTTLVCFPHPTE